MNEAPMSDYDFDVAVINAALSRGDRAFSKDAHSFVLSKVRPEIVASVADFVFGAAPEERELIRSLLVGLKTGVPKLEMRLRYAVVVAPILLQADPAVWRDGLSERIDLIADTNMSRCGGGLSLTTEDERNDALALAFLMNNPGHDVQSFDPEEVRWIGQNMEKLAPLGHLIRERNMQSRSDLQRLLDAPAPSLLDGIL